MSEHLRRVSTMLEAGALSLALAAACQAADSLDGLVDPTAPINMSVALRDLDHVEAINLEQRDGRYMLNSVLIRNSDRIAVVNNQRVRVGDSIGAATVNSIDENGVVLDIDGAPTMLSLYGKAVKKPIAGEQP